ncbi:hypothetical protein B5F07_20245 [Lachnoclostridium sp. An169]|mgnify:CR=1 FL=1|uniref:glycosyl hydrolase n=1 Tax=Lachnoclostridium sp. An169 TaxID=1965569 RepID=UPI000B38CA2F|nr:glycosyl hydrolase [Lachnoclostridium sp. An169]OUP80677.1 hypothetical protein B5F07_20245 [Lachnoclostridium sp. An169]
MALDWTPDLPKEFEERRGYSILPYLPFIGLENMFPPCDVPGYRLSDKTISDMINWDYLETLTQCYCEYHLAGLEMAAEKYEKNIRYQIAYNKPFEVERCGLYVALPENEALGRAAIDEQKNMAAAAHLGRKERYSFECAAEFGHSYGQDYEDVFWGIKRSLMAGMNAQVLHGASYSGMQLKGAEWPGYEGFGKYVSNNWNRTLSIPHARACMDTIARLNAIFRQTAKVDCAILRSRYAETGLTDDFSGYPDGGCLTNHGYSYEFVTEALLELPVCKVEDGILDREGVAYQCLIIMPTDKVSLGCLRKLQKLMEQNLPVVWIGEKPQYASFYSQWRTEEQQNIWSECLEAIWNDARLLHAQDYQQVPEILAEIGVLGNVVLDGSMDLLTASRETAEKNRYYVLYGYNRVKVTQDMPNPDEISVSAMYCQGTTKGSYRRPGCVSRRKIPVRFRGIGTVSICDPWNGTSYPLDFQSDGKGYLTGTIEMEEDEMLIFQVTGQDNKKEKSAVGQEQEAKAEISFDTLELISFEPNSEEDTSFLRSGFAADSRLIRLNRLLPWLELEKELIGFSGKGIYHGKIVLAEKKAGIYVLELGEVSDTFTVVINGKTAPFPDQVMKRGDVTDLLQKGENDLQIEVVSNLYNHLFSEKSCCMERIPIPYRPRKYGIWESTYKKVALRFFSI